MNDLASQFIIASELTARYFKSALAFDMPRLFMDRLNNFFFLILKEQGKLLENHHHSPRNKMFPDLNLTSRYFKEVTYSYLFGLIS